MSRGYDRASTISATQARSNKAIIMKKLILFTTLGLFSLTCLNIAFGQEFEMRDAQVMHDDKQRPSIEVELEPEPKPVKKAWQDFVKDNYDVKVKGIGFLTNKDILKAEKVKIKEMSDKEMDLYTKVVREGDVTKMNVFASLGYDIYIDEKEYPDMYETMEDMATQFLNSYLPKYYQGLVNDAQAVRDDLNKEITNLEEDIADNQDEIVKSREEIEKLQEEIDKLEKDIANKEERKREAVEELEKSKEELDKVNARLRRVSQN